MQAGGLLDTPKIRRRDVLDRSGRVDRQIAMALIREALDNSPVVDIEGVGWTDVLTSACCCTPETLATSVWRGRKKLGR